jgi:hypothetical protein
MPSMRFENIFWREGVGIVGGKEVAKRYPLMAVAEYRSCRTTSSSSLTASPALADSSKIPAS